MTMTAAKNGSGIKILAGIVTTLALAFGSFWAGYTMKVDAKVDTHVEAANKAHMEMDRRITMNEARYAEIIRRLERIERLIDKTEVGQQMNARSN